MISMVGVDERASVVPVSRAKRTGHHKKTVLIRAPIFTPLLSAAQPYAQPGIGEEAADPVSSTLAALALCAPPLARYAIRSE